VVSPPGKIPLKNFLEQSDAISGGLTLIADPDK
jgi:hypothetical protein